VVLDQPQLNHADIDVGPGVVRQRVLDAVGIHLDAAVVKKVAPIMIEIENRLPFNRDGQSAAVKRNDLECRPVDELWDV
jgi:hypothetical protein